MEWVTNKIFSQPYISIGWDFTKSYKFPKCPYLSADTETELYFENEKLSDDKAYQLLLTNGNKWVRENVVVKAYAFTLSDGKNFALFQNLSDFMLAMAMMNTKVCCWYNARFDFAIFDHYLLTNNWSRYEDIPQEKRKHPPPFTYNDLLGEFGQRYQLTLYIPYVNKAYATKTHRVKMIDICNISAGGLAKNLKDWDIKDENGNPIRKLTMQYDDADIMRDLPYMIADTKGLHLLAIKINDTVKELTGFSLFEGDYLTAGGLSKKTFLHYLFKGDYKTNIKSFNHIFPITADEDKYYRDMNLYLGGKCLVNPYKISTIQHNVYKFDENSMYPDKMRNMLYPIGKYKVVNEITDKQNYVYILTIKNFIAKTKPNKIPIMPDILTGEYSDILNIQEPFMIWLDELEELENWYNMAYSIVEIRQFKARKIEGFIEFVDKFYELKCNSKGAVKNTCKLILNSAYGKLAQRIIRIICRHEITDTGYVHTVKIGQDIDIRGMLNVMVGSRITALARTDLMFTIRKICKENVKEYFLYCDTDSAHTLLPYDDVDNVALGKMKSEGIFESAVYLAPKTYMLYNNFETNSKEFEVHCKGVNTEVVKQKVNECATFEKAREIFSSSQNFKSLCSLTVKGGRALIYTDKVIIREETRPKEDDTDVNIEDLILIGDKLCPLM